MCMLTNIEFKCEDCGHDRIASLRVNVTVSSRVSQISADGSQFGIPGPIPTTAGSTHNAGDNGGFACGRCNKVFAQTNQELFDYLTEHNMICESRFVEY